MKSPIRIGTRGSKLALYQAYRVKEELDSQFPHLQSEIVIIKTKGDKILDVALSKIGDKGLFTKELETALFNDEIDMAVHSLKDLPTTFPEGAKLGAVLKRGETRDAFVSVDGRKLHEMGADDVIATSSLRRKAQLLMINKDLKIVEIRGNVNTRIRKMQEGYCSAMVMAAAGLQRLEMDEHISEIIDFEDMVPACGQGAIAIEIRNNDPEIENLMKSINHEETMATSHAEREFLKTLEGGCQIPVGSFSKIKGDKFSITGFISNIDGSQFIKQSAIGFVNDAYKIAVQLANNIYNKGGKEILEQVRAENHQTQAKNKKLEGKVVISTRPTDADDNLPELLANEGAKVISFPMIEIKSVPLDSNQKQALKNLEQYHWVFFTSKHGVVHFFRKLNEVQGNTDLPPSLKIGVIGKKTAVELDYYGYAANFINQGNTSADMLEQFHKEISPIGLNFLIPIAKLTDDALEKSLSENNKVTRVSIYDTILPAKVDQDIIQQIKNKQYDLILFTSPSTFYNFSKIMRLKKDENIPMASIGKTTTKAIQNAGFEPVATASTSTVEGLCETVVNYLVNEG